MLMCHFKKSMFVIPFGNVGSLQLKVNKECLFLFSSLYFSVTEGSDEGPTYLWNTRLHDVVNMASTVYCIDTTLRNSFIYEITFFYILY